MRFSVDTSHLTAGGSYTTGDDWVCRIELADRAVEATGNSGLAALRAALALLDPSLALP